MKILDAIPGEKFAASDWNDVYLKPGKHPRRVDIEHEVYQDPAVAQWAIERAAHDKSCEDLGIAKRGHAAANRKR